MKRLAKTLCGTCNATLDVSDLEPLTPFKCPGCTTELFSPAVLGHLRLDRPIGRTGCFSAYDGFDAKNNIYTTLLCSDGKKCQQCRIGDVVATAENELDKISKLTHPNICPASGRWMVDGHFIVGSPMMDGFDLSEYKPSEQGLLDVVLVLDLLQKAALGLAAAHHRGIVHHNVCPANVHVDARGNVRLKNFFLSRFLHGNCSINDWRHDLIPFEYMSPEKIETSEEDKFGDVFGFAVLAYFLLIGRQPFGGDSREEAVLSRVPQREGRDCQHVGYRRPDAPDTIREEVPCEISDVVSRMLSPDPARRPSLGDFISAVNFHNAETEKDRIYETQWDMVATETDTKPIPRLDKLGLSGDGMIGAVHDSKPVFSIKSLFDRKKRRKT
jgi:serine/threonine-protein kinase